METDAGSRLKMSAGSVAFEHYFDIYADDMSSEWAFTVLSNSSGKEYVVSKDNDYGLRCTCPDFMYRRLRGRVGVPLGDEASYCKHIRLVLDNLDSVVELFVAWGEKEKVNAAVDHVRDLQNREVFLHG